MDITWKNVESTVQPLELDRLSSSNGIYVRKNITKETRTISNIPTDFWLYEETFLTQSEYGQYIDTIANTPEYIAKQKQNKIETLTGQYSIDKCERMISWVATFINSLETVTSLDEVKVKAAAFSTKLTALQNTYTTNCQEVENA